MQWWLQPKGPDTVHLLDDGGPELAYALPEFGITHAVQADRLHAGQPAHQPRAGARARCACWTCSRDERVIDWFCGLGNFTLPIATRAREVLGIEGSEALVQRSRENAALNGLARERRSFVARNLFEMTPAELRGRRHGRQVAGRPAARGRVCAGQGAGRPARRARAAPGWTPPKRIVYVSCNPATLARDAGLLVHQAGYRCTTAGVVNMFPHTAHVESMAVFDREAARA